jgi:hypothetical protein
VKSAELPFQIPAGDFQQETRKDDQLVNAMNGLLELRLNRHQCLVSLRDAIIVVQFIPVMALR